MTRNFPEKPCRYCGKSEYSTKERTESSYYCLTPNCKGELYECTRCNAVFYPDEFGKHGDVWECKKCGAVQWDLTEANRMIEAIRGARFAMSDLMRRGY